MTAVQTFEFNENYTCARELHLCTSHISNWGSERISSHFEAHIGGERGGICDNNQYSSEVDTWHMLCHMSEPEYSLLICTRHGPHASPDSTVPVSVPFALGMRHASTNKPVLLPSCAFILFHFAERIVAIYLLFFCCAGKVHIMNKNITLCMNRVHVRVNNL